MKKSYNNSVGKAAEDTTNTKTPKTEISGLNPKSLFDKFNEDDRTKLLNDLNSPSASIKMRAITALKQNGAKKRYSMFDVPKLAMESLITDEDKKAVEQMPKTIQEVFKNTVAYVEVRSQEDDRTEGIKTVLQKLGAKTIDTLRRTATIFIFKEGLQSSYNKAKKMNIPIVSVLWIEGCRKHMCLVDPSGYPISDLDKYEARYMNPELHKRLRRPKVMTPIIRDRTPITKSITSSPKNDNQTTPLTKNSENVQNYTTPVSHKQNIEISGVVKKSDSMETQPDTVMETLKIDCDESCLATTISKTPSIQSSTASTTPLMKNASNGWTKLLENMHKIHQSNKKPSPLAKTDSLDFYDITPKQNVIKKGRRSLYTPNIEYETPVVVKNLSKITKRRTLYTPKKENVDSDAFKTPMSLKSQKSPIKISVSANKSIGSCQTSSISSQSNVSNLSIVQSHTSKNYSVTNCKSSNLTNPKRISIQVKANISINVTPTQTHAYTKCSSTTSQRKRKFDFTQHDSKENTPPKMKKFSSSTNKQQKPPIVLLRSNSTTSKTVIQDSKRRRTLFVDPYSVNNNN